MVKIYKHTQIGYYLLSVYSVVMLFFTLRTLKTKNYRLGAVQLLIMFIVKGLFGALTVEVDAHALTLRFGLGVIRKKILLQDIETYHIVQNPWYYGWGLRYTPHGWLYNVSGLTAVELQLNNGKTCRIGTDEPKALVAALDTAIPMKR